jgi:hypothetical protein
MAYYHLASAIGGGGGASLGSDSNFVSVLFLALSLCVLGAGLRLLWKNQGGPTAPHTPVPKKKPLPVERV